MDHAGRRKARPPWQAWARLQSWPAQVQVTHKTHTPTSIRPGARIDGVTEHVRRRGSRGSRSRGSGTVVYSQASVPRRRPLGQAGLCRLCPPVSPGLATFLRQLQAVDGPRNTEWLPSIIKTSKYGSDLQLTSYGRASGLIMVFIPLGNRLSSANDRAIGAHPETGPCTAVGKACALAVVVGTRRRRRTPSVHKSKGKDRSRQDGGGWTSEGRQEARSQRLPPEAGRFYRGKRHTHGSVHPNPVHRPMYSKDSKHTLNHHTA
jgi:hypothetical protein